MRIDLKKDHRELYQPGSADFVEVVVPPWRYLAVDGHGDPNTSTAYADAVAALYTVGYAVRAALRERTGDLLVVGPLEGLWSSGDRSSFVEGRKDDWDWTMLIPLPGQVEQSDVVAALDAAGRRKPRLPVEAVRLDELHEGRCLQILHLGSYDDEGPTLARLHDAVMPSLGVTFNGPHHEIYLGEPRRAAPERLRTVLRQPVVALGAGPAPGR